MESEDCKKKRKDSPYKRSRREAIELYRKCQNVMLVFLFMCYLVKNYVLFPLAGKIWSLTISTIPSGFITEKNIITAVLNPYVIVVAVLLLLGFCIVTVWGLSGIMLGFAYYEQGKPVNLFRLMYLALVNMKNLLQPKNWLFFVYIILILPFTNLYSVSGMLSGFKLPEYISDFIFDNTLLFIGFAVLVVFLFWLVVRWFYAIQGVLISGKDFREARRDSVKMVKKRSIRQIIALIFYGIDRLIKLRLLPMIIALVIFGFTIVTMSGYSAGVAAFATIYNGVFIPVFKGLASVCLQMAMMSYIVVNYRIFAQEYGIYQEPDLPEYGVKRAHIHKFTGLRLILYILLIGACEGLLIGNTIFYSAHPDQMSQLRKNTTIIAHKGYSSEAPENTMAAFELAYESDEVNAIELDVRESKDGIPIVIHNATLQSACGVNKQVYDLDYDEIRSYLVTYSMDKNLIKENLAASNADEVLEEMEVQTYGEAFCDIPGCYVPTLEEVLAAYGGKKELLIEIKADAKTPDLPAKIVELLDKYDCKDSCMIHSGSYEALEAVKAVDSSIPCGYIIAIGTGDYYNLPCADFFSVEHDFVTTSMLNTIHTLGKKVYAWTVNEPSSFNKMTLVDVDGVISDYPENAYSKFYELSDIVEGYYSSVGGLVDTDQYEEAESVYEEGDY